MGQGHGHGHGHGHSHAHGHAGGRHRWRLQLALGLVGGFFFVELAAGLISRSLALLSDAGHMAADVVALSAALAATSIATRPDKSGRRTFGNYRAEVFASGLAVLIMFGVSAYIVVEAVSRFGDPVEPAATAMVAVGALGLLVNVIALFLLRGGASESLNVKGAYLEVGADAIGSIGVIVAGLLVSATANPLWDTIIAFAIAIFVIVRAAILGREVLAVLGQHAPSGLDPAEVAGVLAGIEGVGDVHDLHLWQLTSGMNVASAHLMTTEGADHHAVLDRAGHVLRADFGIEHATLQVEPRDHTGCHEISW